MEAEFKAPLLSRSVFAGLFTGIIVSLVNTIYDFIFRGITKFSPSEFINISSLIFGSLLISVLASLLFLALSKYVNKGKMIFTIVILLITIVCGILVISAHGTGLTLAGRGGLLLGMIIITGVLTAFLIPYFSAHSNIYI